MHWARLDKCSEQQSENGYSRSGVGAHLTALDLMLLASGMGDFDRAFTHGLRMA
jgi:hypothetical protein